jgi:hypothetical protein
MPKKGSVNADSFPAADGEKQILLNTQTKPSLNAWKHGAYSNLGLLPGEDPDEYGQFLEKVFLEWAPCGPTETDTVMSLANCMWRKSNLCIYAKAAYARKSHFLVFDGRDSLLWNLEDAQKGALLQFAAVYCTNRAAEKEREKIAMPFVREFQKYAESQLKGEEKSDEKSRDRSAKNTEEKSEEKRKEKSGKKSDEKSKENSKETEEQSDDELLELAKLGDQMTVETLMEEIELEDRLDARIDRMVKRLLHLKAAKQMI